MSHEIHEIPRSGHRNLADLLETYVELLRKDRVDKAVVEQQHDPDTRAVTTVFRFSSGGT